jgi:hypothetical protein
MKLSSVRVGDYTPTSEAAPGRELSNHTDRSGTTIHGWPSIAVGSVFATVGFTIGVLALLGRLQMSGDTPPWIGTVMGAVFAIAGCSFIVHGWAGLAVRRRADRLRATHVQEPWVWDHPWDEIGSRDDAGRRIGRAISFTAFLALFMVPFNWIGFLSPERPLPFTIVAAVMDCTLLGCGWWSVYLIKRRAKYGVSMLRFRRFPFRAGDEVELHLARPRALAGIESPDAVLRCVQERYETRGTGDDRSRVVVAYEMWSATQRAEYVRGEYVWRFAVPEGVPGTALSERPPRYWELEVKIETPGVDYAGVFLVPVYEDRRRRRGG